MNADKKPATGDFEVLEYPDCGDGPPSPAWHDWEEIGDAAIESSANRSHLAPATAAQAPQAEEPHRSFEAGFERGLAEGRKVEREAQATALAAEAEHRRRQLAALAAQIAEQRDTFLRSVEQEVVKLALAVAARILRREAQMDPLLLTGAVRVALGQLAGASEVRLRVPAAEADLWAETIAALPKLAARPLIVAAKEMQTGDCIVESKVGSVDLGVRSQLGEIERGFFDRAAPSTEKKSDAGPSPSSAVEHAAPGMERQ
jgi:flagellar assembly protein FliH